jgi:hypothetical protein
MGYRSFLDPTNRPWEVWLVMPTAAERRKEERRVASASSAAAYSGIERRTTASRRKSSFPRGSVVQAGYENGWLCFQASKGEKRRLVPVPQGWEAASDEQLWLWCSVANRAVRCGP